MSCAELHNVTPRFDIKAKARTVLMLLSPCLYAAVCLFVCAPEVATELEHKSHLKLQFDFFEDF